MVVTLVLKKKTRCTSLLRGDSTTKLLIPPCTTPHLVWFHEPDLPPPVDEERDGRDPQQQHHHHDGDLLPANHQLLVLMLMLAGAVDPDHRVGHPVEGRDGTVV